MTLLSVSTFLRKKKETDFFCMQKKTSFDVLEEGLAKARASIQEAILSRNHNSSRNQEDFIPKWSIYRNPYAFHQLSSKDSGISFLL